MQLCIINWLNLVIKVLIIEHLIHRWSVVKDYIPGDLPQGFDGSPEVTVPCGEVTLNGTAGLMVHSEPEGEDVSSSLSSDLLSVVDLSLDAGVHLPEARK